MSRTILIYATLTVLFAAIDLFYLSLFGVKIFKATLGDVLAPAINPAPGIVFYLLFPIGLCYFALSPAVAADKWTVALLNGALFGFFTYATYDLTNFATIRNWTAPLTLIDMAWGTVLSGVTSVLAFAIQKAVFDRF